MAKYRARVSGTALGGEKKRNRPQTYTRNSENWEQLCLLCGQRNVQLDFSRSDPVVLPIRVSSVLAFSIYFLVCLYFGNIFTNPKYAIIQIYIYFSIVM